MVVLPSHSTPHRSRITRNTLSFLMSHGITPEQTCMKNDELMTSSPVHGLRALFLNEDCWRAILSFLHDDGESLKTCSLVDKQWRVLAQQVLFESQTLALVRPEVVCTVGLDPPGRTSVADKHNEPDLSLRWPHYMLPAVPEAAKARLAEFRDFAAGRADLIRRVRALEYDIQTEGWSLDTWDEESGQPKLADVLAPVLNAGFDLLRTLRLTQCSVEDAARDDDQASILSLEEEIRSYSAPMLARIDMALSVRWPALARVELVDVELYDLGTLQYLLCSLPSLADLVLCSVDFSCVITNEPAQDEPTNLHLRTLVLHDMTFPRVLSHQVSTADSEFLSEDVTAIAVLAWLARTPSVRTLEHVRIDVRTGGYPLGILAGPDAPKDSPELALELKCINGGGFCFGFDAGPRLTSLTVDLTERMSFDALLFLPEYGVQWVEELWGSVTMLDAPGLRELTIRFTRAPPKNPSDRKRWELLTLLRPELRYLSLPFNVPQLRLVTFLVVDEAGNHEVWRFRKTKSGRFDLEE